MSTPTPTEAHIDLVESVRFSNDRSSAIQISDSEARAVAAITTERDQLRADNLIAHKMACAAAIERDQLRDQLHALGLICGTTDAEKFATWVDRANARAESAEAELDATKVRALTYAGLLDLAQAELATERETAERYRLSSLKLDAKLLSITADRVSRTSCMSRTGRTDVSSTKGPSPGVGSGHSFERATSDVENYFPKEC